tara:strand:+ start:2930 stop:3898 length:969 start_codon:yes stop_codon:yes gene_type:complete
MENLKLIKEGLGELNMNLLTSSEIDDMNSRLRQGHTMWMANERIRAKIWKERLSLTNWAKDTFKEIFKELIFEILGCVSDGSSDDKRFIIETEYRYDHMFVKFRCGKDPMWHSDLTIVLRTPHEGTSLHSAEPLFEVKMDLPKLSSSKDDRKFFDYEDNIEFLESRVTAFHFIKARRRKIENFLFKLKMEYEHFLGCEEVFSDYKVEIPREFSGSAESMVRNALMEKFKEGHEILVPTQLGTDKYFALEARDWRISGGHSFKLLKTNKRDGQVKSYRIEITDGTLKGRDMLIESYAIYHLFDKIANEDVVTTEAETIEENFS